MRNSLNVVLLGCLLLAVTKKSAGQGGTVVQQPQASVVQQPQATVTQSQTTVTQPQATVTQTTVTQPATTTGSSSTAATGVSVVQQITTPANQQFTSVIQSPANLLAVIDTRAYSVCQLVAANAASGIIQGNYGTLQKPAIQVGKSITWLCSGTGIENDSGNSIVFTGFPCNVIDSSGTQHLTQTSTATLSPSGAETLQCTYMLS